MSEKLSDFDNLTPDLVIEAVETVLDLELTNYTQPMPSYINRVYELKDLDDQYYIVKFYRPGRWSQEALLEEHAFMLDCAVDDIPLAAPLPMTGLVDNAADAPTLGRIEGFPFAVFNRKGGRLWEAGDPDSWLRMGRLLGRMHNAGAARTTRHRPVLSADASFAADIEELKSSDWVHPEVKTEVFTTIDRLQAAVDAVFSEYAPAGGSTGSDSVFIRVHGDFHSGNILERPDEGLMLMDFDDMAMSLPVQDLWLLLPDYAPESGAELSAMVEGYREFRAFNTETLMLIESLRAMRMVYFLCWCGRQKNDFRFQHNFPDWGCRAFWHKEVQDLEAQHDHIKRASEEQRLIY